MIRVLPLTVWCNPRQTASGVSGSRSNQTPVASWTAQTMAGARGPNGTSPTPLTPSGPSGSGFSNR